VVYKWAGDWQQLKSGVVILTWQEVDGKDYWMHDHGIAMGGLMAEKLTPEEQQKGFEVTEKTAMQSAGNPRSLSLICCLSQSGNWRNLSD
jgi:hypothetical protein